MQVYFRDGRQQEAQNLFRPHPLLKALSTMNTQLMSVSAVCDAGNFHDNT